MYLKYTIHIVRQAWPWGPPSDGAFGAALPVRVRFSARRAWPFFDIWILSISPFWVARVEFAPSPGNLETAVAFPQKRKFPNAIHPVDFWCA